MPRVTLNAQMSRKARADAKKSDITGSFPFSSTSRKYNLPHSLHPDPTASSQTAHLVSWKCPRFLQQRLIITFSPGPLCNNENVQ